MRLLGGDADAIEAAKHAAKVAALDLPYISPVSLLISHRSLLDLLCISPRSRPHLPQAAIEAALHGSGHHSSAALSHTRDDISHTIAAQLGRGRSSLG